MKHKNTILVTGLSLLRNVKSAEDCVPCNYEFDWVFNYPSSLLWADRIIVSPSIMDIIKKETWPTDKQSPVAKVLHIFFNIAGEYNLVHIRDPYKELADDFHEIASKQAIKDRKALAKRFPDKVKLGNTKKVPGSFKIEGLHYCEPRVRSMYQSIALARIWNSRLLLNDYTAKYFAYRFKIIKGITASQEIEAFQQIFGQRLPEIAIAPFIGKRTCWNCKRAYNCDSHQLIQIENAIRKFIKWRDYDEIYQMKIVFDAIAKSSADKDYTAKDIQREFKEKEVATQKKLYSVFPKVQRWSNLTTILSIPVIVAGSATASPLLAGLGAGIAGISKTIEKYITILESKSRWVCFNQSNK
ncbi:MAG TPA: hypothetical protein VFG06_11180 [Thermodesulfovibrionales bacterium]|nr:hypothetical protein [Thermodesulfovibrionales bacterium]